LEPLNRTLVSDPESKAENEILCYLRWFLFKILSHLCIKTAEDFDYRGWLVSVLDFIYPALWREQVSNLFHFPWPIAARERCGETGLGKIFLPQIFLPAALSSLTAFMNW
jgi:hypothetical protein